mgnify:CR=1 FL=1
MNREIHINSEIKNISVVEKLVEEVCDSIFNGKELYGNILVAVLEAVTNCIIHGNKRISDKQVTIKIYASVSEIVFIISDQGEGFDINSIPDPTRYENLENPHGRGIFLMKKLSDYFEYDETLRAFILKFYPEKKVEIIQ